MQARALKRPRLVWTPKLHMRFVAAVEQLGLKNAVPKTIMQARRCCSPSYFHVPGPNFGSGVEGQGRTLNVSLTAARALRLVVEQLGLKNAVPKMIMQAQRC